MKEYITPGITDEQKAIAQPLLDAFPNLCLMSGKYKDQDVAIVCTVHTQIQDETVLSPMMMLITEDMMDDVVNCIGQGLEPTNNPYKKEPGE